MDDAELALLLARIRIAIGAAAVAMPGVSARALSGRKASGIEPLLARMLGVRDIALGLGAVVAVDKGAPVRGWLEAAALSDSADFLSCLLARKRMRRTAVTATLLLGGGSAAAGVYLARRLDPPPPPHPHQPEATVTGHSD